jgi:multiple sugar transport system substrate-binding protein
MPALLAACGAMRRRPAVVAAKPSGTVTFGSNEAGGVTIRRSAVMRWWRPTRRNPAQVKINAVDHNTFQENINNYLQGNADDVFSWFAGYRMQFCRRAGLIVTSATCGENLSGFKRRLQEASTGADGKQYFVPDSNYPWRSSTASRSGRNAGTSPATTFDEFTGLVRPDAKGRDQPRGLR